MPASSSVNLNRLAAFVAVAETGSFTAGVHAAYPNVRYTPAKVRAFVDFFRERMA